MTTLQLTTTVKKTRITSSKEMTANDFDRHNLERPSSP